MPTLFSKLLLSAKNDHGKTILDVPEDWMQGRSVFGGLQIALALRAMRSLEPELPLRTVSATFVAPAAGRLSACANLLRRSKSTVHAEARIVDGDATLVHCAAVFGRGRSSAVSYPPPPPEPSPDEPVAFPFVPGVIPSFVQHFENRWLSGKPPFTGDTARRHVIEVCLHDDEPTTEAHVVAIADLPPPVALSHLTTPVPASTLTWHLEFLTDRLEELPLSGWRLLAELDAAGDGYTSQSVMVWGPGGVPVATGRQCMVVFG